MIRNYRVNFGGDKINYRDNFKDCRQYFPILKKLYAVMEKNEIVDAWHFFEPYVEFTWVVNIKDAPNEKIKLAIEEAILQDVLKLLTDNGIEPSLVHRPGDGVIVDWYCTNPEEQEFGYKTYALSAKIAMLFWKYREAIQKGCGEKNQFMRRPHVLANQIGMNYFEESDALYQRGILAELFWKYGHEEAVKRYEEIFNEKYL